MFSTCLVSILRKKIPFPESHEKREGNDDGCEVGSFVLITWHAVRKEKRWVLSGTELGSGTPWTFATSPTAYYLALSSSGTGKCRGEPWHRASGLLWALHVYWQFSAHGSHVLQPLLLPTPLAKGEDWGLQRWSDTVRGAWDAVSRVRVLCCCTLFPIRDTKYSKTREMTEQKTEFSHAF